MWLCPPFRASQHPPKKDASESGCSEHSQRHCFWDLDNAGWWHWWLPATSTVQKPNQKSHCATGLDGRIQSWFLSHANWGRSIRIYNSYTVVTREEWNWMTGPWPKQLWILNGLSKLAVERIAWWLTTIPPQSARTGKSLSPRNRIWGNRIFGVVT